MGTAAKNLVIGDLVWAKMKGYPWWPGQIQMGDKPRPGVHKVFFFGTYDAANTKFSNIKEYAVYADELSVPKTKRPLKGFATAVEEIKRAYTDKLEYEKELGVAGGGVDSSRSDEASPPPKKQNKKRPVKKEAPANAEGAVAMDIDDPEAGSDHDTTEELEEEEEEDDDDDAYVPKPTKRRRRSDSDADEEEQARSVKKPKKTKEERAADKAKREAAKAVEKDRKVEDMRAKKEQRDAVVQEKNRAKEQLKQEKLANKKKAGTTKQPKQDLEARRREQIERLKAKKIEEKKEKKRIERIERGGTPAQRLALLESRLGQAFSKDGRRDERDALRILGLLDEFHMTLELLRTTKVAKMVKRLQKAQAYPGIVEKSKALQQKWVRLIQEEGAEAKAKNDELDKKVESTERFESGKAKDEDATTATKGGAGGVPIETASTVALSQETPSTKEVVESKDVESEKVEGVVETSTPKAIVRDTQVLSKATTYIPGNEPRKETEGAGEVDVTANSQEIRTTEEVTEPNNEIIQMESGKEEVVIKPSTFDVVDTEMTMPKRD